MFQHDKIELLISELTSIKNFNDRRIVISNDILNNTNKYKILAEYDPIQLFKILGGDEDEIVKSNWALEYKYEDYVDEYGLEYDSKEADKWDLMEKSIEHANDSGHWYVTGICKLKGPNNIELPFEFEYCEGYFNGIIGTPYNVSEHGKHGFLFD